jgi:esterase/lipase superfamily enzyme
LTPGSGNPAGRSGLTTATIRAVACLAVCLAVAACAPRGQFSAMPATQNVDQVQPVFVVTRRGGGPGLLNRDGTRSDDTLLGRIDVSIPANHEKGRIEWPRGTSDQDEAFRVASAVRFPSLARFGAEVRSAAPASDEAITVFVPGYNNTLAEATYRLAQIAHDYDLERPPILFAWPSAAQPLEYVYDRDSILNERDALERLLTELGKTQNRKILLVAHSLGSQLVVETLRQMSIGGNRVLRDRLEGVILLSPDIDIDLFRSQIARVDPLPASFVIVVSQSDRVLRLSARLTGQTARLGTLSDFDQLSDFGITVIDLTGIEGRNDGNHLIAATSPVAISILSGLEETGLPPDAPKDGALSIVRVVFDLPSGR